MSDTGAGGPGGAPRPSAPQEPAGPLDPSTVSGKIVRWTAAVLLTVIALLLGFVPGVPGVPLFIMALFLVAVYLRPARALGNWVLRKVKPARRVVPKWIRKTRKRNGGPRA